MLKFNPSRRLLGAAVAAVSLLALAPSTALAVKQTGGEYNTLYAGLGAKGYDVVSYFTDKAQAQGSDKFTATYGDINKTFARDTEGFLSKAERNRGGLDR